MSPILIPVEHIFTMIEVGKYNIINISDKFGCDLITLEPNRKL